MYCLIRAVLVIIIARGAHHRVPRPSLDLRPAEVAKNQPRIARLGHGVEREVLTAPIATHRHVRLFVF